MHEPMLSVVYVLLSYSVRYKHSVFAPALFGGYTASLFPGVAEAIAAKDYATAADQAASLAACINGAASRLRAPADTACYLPAR